MADKKQNKENGSIKSAMPETMFSETTATKVRWSIDDAISDLHFAVLDLRQAGVPIETVKDLQEITKESLKAQRTKDKEAYFKNMRFVPAGLRRQVNQEFADMEATLLPLADQLVRTRKRVPLTYTVNVKDKYATGEYCIKCDDKELEDYVRKAATTTILPEYREYYEAITSFCESWKKLQGEAERLHIVRPDKRLINDLMKSYSPESADGLTVVSDMCITPEKMFALIRNNDIIRMQTAEELGQEDMDEKETAET